MVANTNPFDPAGTASSGDVWAETVNPNATYTVAGDELVNIPCACTVG